MRTFEEGNWTDDVKCPLCKTSDKGEVVLIPVLGTQKGNCIEAIQVHTKCIEKYWFYDKKYDEIIVKNYGKRVL